MFQQGFFKFPYLKIPYKVFIISILLFHLNAHAQVFVSPVKDDTVTLASVFNIISARYKTASDGLQGENKKYAANIYRDRFNSIKMMFDTRELLTLPEATGYLQALANEIIRANPALQPLSINFFFSKTAIPNAASVGEGVIIFNTGLFTKLDNESQAVFVLCHELAHLYLNHNNKSIDKYVATLYSKETQGQLKNIKNSTYNKRAQLEGLLKGLTFDNKRHSRYHESEADSLGLQFMKNTGFDVGEALTCLALLDSVDNDNTDMPRLLGDKFNSAEYPFKKRWIAKAESSFGVAVASAEDKKEADSLKTHPDCAIRIAALKNEVEKLANGNRKKDLINRAEFLHLQTILPGYTVAYYYETRQYSQALFYALEMLDKDSGNAYAIAVIGQTLNRVYEAEKTHMLAKLIDHPSPYYSAAYNTVLRLIENLYPEDVAAINYYFLKQHEAQLGLYPEYKTAYLSARSIAGK